MSILSVVTDDRSWKSGRVNVPENRRVIEVDVTECSAS